MVKKFYPEYIENIYNSIIKQGKDLTGHFIKENRQIAKKKRCSTALVIREMQIKSTMRYLISLSIRPSIRMASIKTIRLNVGKDTQKSEHSDFADENVK